MSEENMNLKQIIMGMTNYSKNGVNFILDAEEQKILLKYIEDLQQRIDKAIDYIEDYKDQWCRNNEVISDMNELLSILKGKDVK